MKPTAAIANSLWIASSFPAWRSFRSALHHPAQVQQEWLRAHLARNSGSEFARKHKLTATQSYEEFAQRVPVQDYESLEPWITRVQRGEPRVLTNERVTHLIPTSGSTGARKLIPFTAGLQRDFDRAIAPWICDLARQQPGILGGPAYWSISPAIQTPAEPAAVPIGFADDASYLGGGKGWLVRAAIVAPSEPLNANDLDAFQRTTLHCLLHERELRLISVWHPSFLTMLLDTLPLHWSELLADIARDNPARERELQRANPLQPETLWPRLRVISCWGDAHAGFGFVELQRRFPRTHIQPKGLLATEAFVTVPFAGKHPLAVRSHFFEFADEAGRIRRAHELHAGATYEVIVTTSGGLWRYRLGDQVRVTGFVNASPTLQFLGRRGGVSDRFGEKLSEPFVLEALRELFGNEVPRFSLLAPDMDNAGGGYTLYVEGATRARWAESLERLLARNPHYALCRNLGQLRTARVFAIAHRGYESFVQRLTAEGSRLGEIKPASLSLLDGWSKVFPGGYVDADRPEIQRLASSSTTFSKPLTTRAMQS